MTGSMSREYKAHDIIAILSFAYGSLNREHKARGIALYTIAKKN
jgi:hypothetical protein